MLERLANMAIELFARAATISRTQRLLADGDEATHAEMLALCDLFCVLSGRRFRAARNALDNSEEAVDDARRTAAAAVRASEGYYVSDSILDTGRARGSGAHGRPEDRLSDA